jgi:hypothetical protein
MNKNTPPNLVQQVRKRKVSYNQLSEEEKRIYWDNFKKLADLGYETQKLAAKSVQG